ncbi:putative transcription factor bHLH family [Lupinus albus]|uniref:Putative transcription factor bHLH family n=1 Tax=Lupinus albus TaxID=3870 RepID=A0A6A4Q2K1_LUPAL|nr:putative transcription factor bHLH family [Lupinus albus]
MYEENDNCFDPNAMLVQGTITENHCYSQINSESEPKMSHISATQTNNNNVGLSMEIITSYPSSYSCENQQDHAIIATTTTATTTCATNAMELGFDMENNDPYNNFTTHFVVEDVTNNNDHGSSQNHSFDQCHHQDMKFPSYPKPTPDLLNFLHLSPTKTSSLGNSSISFENITPHNNNGTWVGNNCNYNHPIGVSYDPYLHLNLPTQPPLFQSLVSHGYTVPRNDFVFGDDIEGSGIAAFQEFENGVIELSNHDVGKRRRGKSTKQFTSTTERQRRVDLGGKFDALKELIPNPSKSDRASVVGDAIDYIKELLRTVNELKILVEKKRYEKQRMMKRHKVEEEGDASIEGDLMNTTNNHSYNESLRSSWIQRKSKDTEIDVRIIDNEVTIKLVQRKKINCLVYASQVLDELNLDLQHVAGGHIGDFSSFMFNTKICEGSSVYASAIANKLIEVMDKNLATA